MWKLMLMIFSQIFPLFIPRFRHKYYCSYFHRRISSPARRKDGIFALIISKGAKYYLIKMIDYTRFY